MTGASKQYEGELAALRDLPYIEKVSIRNRDGKIYLTAKADIGKIMNKDEISGYTVEWHRKQLTFEINKAFENHNFKASITSGGHYGPKFEFTYRLNY